MLMFQFYQKYHPIGSFGEEICPILQHNRYKFQPFCLIESIKINYMANQQMSQRILGLWTDSPRAAKVK